MVFYTCSGCGESLKKNKVENHLYTCRYCEYLTCIDCSKDFYGDDYKTHTSCMTEDQKYSAKGTEFKPNKGDLKQQQWLQRIDEVISSDVSLSKKAKDLLSNLKNYDNIPRKRAKFLNFLKNSLRIYDTKLGEEVWEVFSAASAKPDQSAAKAPSSQKTTDEPSENVPDGKACAGDTALQKRDKKAMKKTEDSVAPTEVVKKRKKKLKAAAATAENGDCITPTESEKNSSKSTSNSTDKAKIELDTAETGKSLAIDTSGTEKIKKKKKKKLRQGPPNGADTGESAENTKSNKQLDVDTAKLDTHVPASNSLGTSQKKSKKKKSKKGGIGENMEPSKKDKTRSAPNQCQTLENENRSKSHLEEVNSEKKIKKKSKKRKASDDDASVTTHENGVESKKKKPKSQNDTAENGVVKPEKKRPESQNGTTENGTVKPKKKKSKKAQIERSIN